MSHVVAVAGGTGNLGRAIVEAIVADGKIDVLILSRKADAEKEKEIGARVLAVDYSSVDALVKVLEDNNVDTVISTLSSIGAAQPEFNLIAAADKAAATKRFVPSIWGAKYPDKTATFFPPARTKLDIVAAVAGTSLEYTVWYPGYFTDYFVAPHVKTYMTILPFALDVPNNVAAIPGSGNVPLVLTHTFDVAKFVAASLALPKWRPDTYLIGDRVTWNEMLAIAEEVKGAKFKVTYDSMEMLRSGKVTELPGHVPMYAFMPKEQLQGFLSVFGALSEEGMFDLRPEHAINQDFPDIKPRTVRELMTEAWKGK